MLGTLLIKLRHLKPTTEIPAKPAANQPANKSAEPKSIQNTAQPESANTKPVQTQARNPHLTKMRRMTCYIFLGDSSNMTFHRKNCTLLENTKPRTLCGLGLNPKKKWRPCSECKPRVYRNNKKHFNKIPYVPVTTAVLWALWEEKLEQIAMRSETTKAELLGMQLKMLCEEKGIFAEIWGSVIYMTTISGEWYFNFIGRPIKLLHRDHKWNNGFHRQEKDFTTPIKVLSYIQKHDYSYMKARYLDVPERYHIKDLESILCIRRSGQYLM